MSSYKYPEWFVVLNSFQHPKLESEIKSNYKLHIHLVSLSFGEGWGEEINGYAENRIE
jgi:hypothetical protein